jgi:hypothetical protein
MEYSRMYPGEHVIALRKVRATWYWCHHNPQGGSFGSNYCGPQRIAIEVATRGLAAGQLYRLIVDERDRGIRCHP